MPILPAIDCYSKREEIPLSEATSCSPFVHFSAKPVIGARSRDPPAMTTKIRPCRLERRATPR